ncbi:unnamed protein product [Tilletia caries]|uniref:MPN domain-containing protein n=2 Tax=Tilletia TaxID=13289 RepID=A0A177U7A3_9BASI|nr:hypothetical protein CF335_g4852 [Tilletia laevis]KAE8257438.1 hypothetical protein A4X03_0g4666 [Tilletia caries]CAD6923669.1 unnamed protein product [Tilletia caries]CAD7061639.1 unnamed protein product [Tilletia caries]
MVKRGAQSAGAANGGGGGGGGGGASDEEKRFHLPIPSVFRPSRAKRERERQPSTRPATLAELADAAQTADLFFTAQTPVRRYLAGAHGLNTQADTYLAATPTPDYEHAFICLAKAARLLLDLIPNSHPGWKTDLTPETRKKAQADAQLVLDKMGRCKPILIDNFDKWKAAHPKISDITTVPTAISQPTQPIHPEQLSPYEHDSQPENEPELEQPSPSPTLRYRRPERQTDSFDVRNILGYDQSHPATATAAQAPSSPSYASSSSSSSRSTSTNSITYSHTIPYAASSSSSSSNIEPWSSTPSTSTQQQQPNRFAYPILRRSSTQRSSHSNAQGQQRRQQTADSTTSSVLMTPDQSGQGFAPRTALGESYYMTLPPALSLSAVQQTFPCAAAPPPPPPSFLPPSALAPSVQPLGPATGSVSAPNTPLNARPPSVLGPRPLGSPAQPGPGPPRPAKSLGNIPIPPQLQQQQQDQQAPFSPLHQSVPSLPPRAVPPTTLDLSRLDISEAALPAIDPDGGASRLERHATQLLTLGRHSRPPASQDWHPSISNPAPVPAPAPAPVLPQRQRPRRTATEEEDAQLALALEASRRDMEELERKAAAASTAIPARAPPPMSGSGAGRGMSALGGSGVEGQDFPATACTEGGTPLRTVILPTRVLTLFLALARENTENNIETCALLMGKLRTHPHPAFVISHLTVPAQKGSSDRCETHEEEAIWAFQEESGLVTVGWIHTHPSQSAFLSSLDLHTHCSFQAMTPEAIAIVCAPRHEPSFGLFRLTDPHGVQTIMHCRAPGLFHPHVSETGDDIPALYTDALHGHVRLDPEAKLMVVDLR